MEQNLEKKIFMELSVLLTGFNLQELESTGQLPAYYQLFRVVYPLMEPVNFDDNGAMAIRSQIKTAYALPSLKAAKDLQDAIIILWYSGVWKGNYANEFAFAEGLMWKTFHAHPPAHKQPGFASWSVEPLTVKKDGRN